MIPNDEPEFVEMELLKLVPQTSYGRLIVRQGYERDAELAMAYENAAKRLASTFEGKPQDDLLLLPFLMLYRQAFELTLKNMIWSFAGWRRTFVDPTEPLVQRKALSKSTWGHKLGELLDSLLDHYAALDLNEQFPQSVVSVVRAIDRDDPTGTGFRYTNHQTPFRSFADFVNLRQLLDEQYNLLLAVHDWADDLMTAIPRDTA